MFRAMRSSKFRVTEDQYFEASYPFLREDCFLIARVDKFSGNQELIIIKTDEKGKNIEFEDKIKCIHTVVCTLEAEDIEESLDHEDFTEKVLNIRSSEKLQEINLSPEEKFKAFKSWVAGIAESGLNAFKIQSDIEKAAEFVYPIAEPLMKFMIKVDKVFVFQFLDMVERLCQYEGVRHDSSMISNLTLVLDTIYEDFISNPDGAGDIVTRIVEMNPPIELFQIKKFNIFILAKEMLDYSNFEDFASMHDFDILGFYLSNKIRYYKQKVNESSYDSVEETKAMAKLYRMMYVYEQDLKGIREIKKKEVRQAVHRVNVIRKNRRDIRKRLPVELEFLDYNPQTAQLDLKAKRIRNTDENNEFLEKIIVKICRQLMPNFSFGIIKVLFDEINVENS